jgi:uncharacterized coiled-coil DUF342 family protein
MRWRKKMSSAFEMIKEIMTLTSQVGALRSDVDGLRSKVEDHHERIIKLETREDLLKSEMASGICQ